MNGRYIAGLLGAGLLVIAIVKDDPAVVIAAVAGILLIGITLAFSEIFPDMKSAQIKGLGGTGVNFEMQERQAAAEAASVDPPAELESSIASDDPGLPVPSTDDPMVIGTLNYMAGSISLGAIFDWSTRGGPLAGCDVRLYLYDSVESVLRTVPPESTTPWAPGRGAVGEAYSNRKFVLACGAAVSDSTHHLDEEQQARYRSLAAVAATPVFNSRSQVIGVVSAASSDLAHDLGTPEAKRDLNITALLVSRVLIELLQWFDD